MKLVHWPFGTARRDWAGHSPPRPIIIIIIIIIINLTNLHKE